jgi:3-deoxy-7-phosphoheptulonate synthase
MALTPNDAASNWFPGSWQARPARQQPSYPDPAALSHALAQLSFLPPLVTSWEIERLKEQLGDAVRGDRFLLQGGDCSEAFADCESAAITRKLKILLQMSMVLVQGGKRRVIRVGRFAGQYAKPRSSDLEVKDGVSLPAYRGDLINRPGFTPAERIPNPDLLLRAYERSALTLNFIRALVDGGFADLHHPEYWDLGFASKSPLAGEYRALMDALLDSLRFVETVTGGKLSDIERVDFFTSHEALHLAYEQALTRQVPRREGWYNLSTHLPWVGDRTRALDGAHIEYLRGIANPVAVKLGPSITPDEAVALTQVLNPHNEPGRLTFILRFGANKIEAALPAIVEAIRGRQAAVLWCCDPMHGNTETTSQGIKTRRFENILRELRSAAHVLRECDARLGGVHFELTGENVTECVGGASGVTEADLSRDYRTQVDPRLNFEQALEMAMLLASLLRET